MPTSARPLAMAAQNRIAAPECGPAAMLVWALAVTGLPVAFHLTGQFMGIAVCVLLSFMLAQFSAAALPIALVFSWLTQNLFVAFVSPYLDDSGLNSVRAYSFLLTIVTWVVLIVPYWLDRATFDPRLRTLMNWTTSALVCIGIYVALGMARNPSSALIYFRNIATPFFLFQTFALVAARHRVAMTKPLALIGAATLLYGYLELVAHQQLFQLVNGDYFIEWRVRQEYESGVWLKEMQETGRVMRSYLDTLLVDFLNTPLLSDLGLRFYRLVGPNFHSISFAYVLTFMSVVLMAAGHRWFAVLVIPLLLVIGSKGSLILFLMVTAAFVIVRRARGSAPFWLYSGLLLLYASVGIVMGMRMQDYHVIGLIGGINGFLQNPMGHGIGVGGNLSLNMATIDWSRSQNLGQTDIAVESAIGVLLYQMGVFGFVVLGILVIVAERLWRAFEASGNRLFAVISFGMLTIVTNGLFQEEAMFAPLALAMMTAMAGLLLGRVYQARGGPVPAVRDVISGRRMSPA
jgi:hypothetical protein